MLTREEKQAILEDPDLMINIFSYSTTIDVDFVRGVKR